MCVCVAMPQGILVSWLGTELVHLQWKCGVPVTGPPGNSLLQFLLLLPQAGNKPNCGNWDRKMTGSHWQLHSYLWFLVFCFDDISSMLSNWLLGLPKDLHLVSLTWLLKTFRVSYPVLVFLLVIYYTLIKKYALVWFGTFNSFYPLINYIHVVWK